MRQVQIAAALVFAGVSGFCGMARLLALGNRGPNLRRRQFAPRPALQLGVPARAGSWIGGSWVKASYVSEAIQERMLHGPVFRNLDPAVPRTLQLQLIE